MKHKQVIFLLLFFIMIIILVAVYVLFLYEQAEKNIYSNLEEIVKQDAEKIKLEIQSHENALVAIAREVERYQIKEKEEIFAIWNEYPPKNTFTRMAIMDEEGNLVTNDGKVLDFSEEKEKFFASNEIQITEPRKSKIENNLIHIYSQKVKVEDMELILMLVLENENYEQIFSKNIFEGKGHSYLQNEEGKIMATSNTNYTKSKEEEIRENISEKERTKLYQELEKLQENLQTQKNGNMKIKAIQQNYYVSYRNIGIHNWSIISVVPENIIAEGIYSIIIVSTTLMFFITLCIIISSIYIVVQNNKKQKQLYQLAYIDSLTKLGNIHFLKENAKQYIKKGMYFIVLDIEKFKILNEQYGFYVGDKILIEVANILKKEGLCVSRLSNDVFAGFISTKDIKTTLENVIKTMRKRWIDGYEYVIAVSIGCYQIQKETEQIEYVLNQALMAHRRAKGNALQPYYIYNEQLKEQLLKEHTIESKMEEAIQKEQFVVYYQAKVDTKTQMPYGAEALVRWKDKENIISPKDFIPIFEKNHFILKLDLYIFEKVCQDLQKRKREKRSIPIISINVSREHFVIENFLEEYIEMTKKYQIETKYIELEITESAAGSKNYALSKITRQMKEAGFQVSIDDFGTGYSSLSVLQSLAIDTIKIDKTFINNLEQDTNMVEMIINISKKLGIKTVAEGVETKEQREILLKLGCDSIQGYYYAKPLPAEEFWRKEI